jgi:hypothetical protein
VPPISDRIRSAAPRGAGEKPASPGLRETVLHDLRDGGFPRSLRRDLEELHEFYLSDETRARLESMPRIKRWFLRAWWLLEQLVLKLSPTRRLLLLISLALSVMNGLSYHRGNVRVDLQVSVLSFVILLVVLMLELKDKLLVREEIEVGRAVQKALLPSANPNLPGWDLCLFTRPANDVGGDLVDFLRLRGDHLGLALGDVAGKGLGAALLMAKLQATLRAFAPNSESLAVLGTQVNAIFCRDSLPERFATLVYFELGPNSGEVRLLNAGHPLPIVVRAGSIEQLPPAALPLGFLPDAEYTQQRLDVGPGDLLLVYSDGLTEAGNRAGELFGDERLLALVPQLRGLTAEAAAARLVAEVERFAGDARQSDDLSLVLARRAT